MTTVTAKGPQPIAYDDLLRQLRAKGETVTPEVAAGIRTRVDTLNQAIADYRARDVFHSGPMDAATALSKMLGGLGALSQANLDLDFYLLAHGLHRG